MAPRGFAAPWRLLPFLLSTIFLFQCASQDPYAMYDGMWIVKLKACDQKAVDVILKDVNGTDCTFGSEEGTLELPTKGCATEYVICPPKVAEKLAKKDGAKIDRKDAGDFFRKMGGTTHGYDASGVHAANDFYTQYRNLAAIEARVKQAVDNSNGLATLEELSPKTHEGRTIKVVRIRDKQWKAGRPRVVFTFQIHAREWVAGMTGSYTVENFLNAIKQEPDYIAGMEIIMVPISNPDGFAYSASSNRFWRKNRREQGRCDGVDLNRNWGKAWNGGQSNSRDTCSDVYIGTAAHSEPETQALKKLIDEAKVNVHIDIHCFSELILGPWSYTRTRHPEKTKIDQLGMAMQRAIKEVHGKTYRYGTGGEVIYLASGVFPDYTTEKWGAYGYCYELRPGGNAGRNGFAPPASQILPTAEEAIQGIYTAIDWAKDQGEPLPPAPPPPGEGGGGPSPPNKPPTRRRRGKGGSSRRRSKKSRRRSSKSRRRSKRRRRRSKAPLADGGDAPAA